MIKSKINSHWILFFDNISINDIDKVGGKNASLGEMRSHFTGKQVAVPNGFALTVAAYQQFLYDNQLATKIQQIIDNTKIDNVKQLKTNATKIRRLILQAKLSTTIKQQIKLAYQQLQFGRYKLAVRSSATAEDLPEASFAGQQATFVNVSGIDNTYQAIKQVYASLFTERAISYRHHQNITTSEAGISVGIQRMVASDNGASGVIFTIDTESGFDDVILITGAYGLGEGVVSGKISPDEFYVSKKSLAKNKHAIIMRKIGHKQQKLVGSGKTVTVPKTQQQQFCLTDAEIHTLANQALLIEKYYQRPMDIEWVKEQKTGQLFIVQARPETVSKKQKAQHQQFHLQETGKLITTGYSIGQQIGQGKARIINSPKQMHQLKAGEVLVTDMTDPDWEPVMKIAAAIVTNRGGRTCHAAIVARELGIPAVVGTRDGTKSIKDKQSVTVSCAEGEIGHIYQGKLKFKQTAMDYEKMPSKPVKLALILGNPDRALAYSNLPNDGVGLARLEFIIGNMIGIHPNALINFDKLPGAMKNKIKPMISAYPSPTDYYIERLAEGIATIAAAFYPKTIIVRFSDFKTNEYANLIGGEIYEPHEENPMLGYRGAARYLQADFQPCFKLEIEAIKRVRNDMGFDNVHTMVPFVRTLTEAKQVRQLITKFGIKPGQCPVYMMCEIPSNALLAEEFLQYFDGFSIGSNDLTQLTLGIDRNSEIIASSFDERDLAVKELLAMAIKACKKQNKYVGICGQGPSDHPKLAEWLLQQGIESISLSPDSIVETWFRLANNKK